MTLYEFGKEYQSRYLGRVDVMTIRHAACSEFVDEAAEATEVFVRLPLRGLDKFELFDIMERLVEAMERSVKAHEGTGLVGEEEGDDGRASYD